MERIVYYYLKDGRWDVHTQYTITQFAKYCREVHIISENQFYQNKDEFLEIDRTAQSVQLGYSLCSAIEYMLQDSAQKSVGEIIFVTNELCGPIYPISEMFEQMERQSCDMWGLNFDYVSMECGEVIKYVNIDFVVLRENLYKNTMLLKLFTNTDCKNTTLEDISVMFSRKVLHTGYTIGSCVYGQEFYGVNNILKMMPYTLVENYKVPFFNPKVFANNELGNLNISNGDQARKLMNYLVENRLYNTNCLWDDLIRNSNMHDVVSAMNLYFTTRSAKAKNDVVSQKKTLVIAHLYYEDILNSTLHYLKNVPAYMDILITTNTERKKRIIEKLMETFANNVRVVVVNPRGRSESAFLLGARELLRDYEYACFVHDKKTAQVKPAIIGYEFWRCGVESCLASSEHIENIIQLFNDNTKLGLLNAEITKTGPYCLTDGVYNWSGNYENVKMLCDRLHLNCHLDETKIPIAPLGSYFWFRVDALGKLLYYPWVLNDFPQEPLPVDNTLLHAIERIYPFVAQDAGYYSGYITTDEMLNARLTYYQRELSKVIIETIKKQTSTKVISNANNIVELINL